MLRLLRLQSEATLALLNDATLAKFTEVGFKVLGSYLRLNAGFGGRSALLILVWQRLRLVFSLFVVVVFHIGELF